MFSLLLEEDEEDDDEDECEDEDDDGIDRNEDEEDEKELSSKSSIMIGFIIDPGFLFGREILPIKEEKHKEVIKYKTLNTIKRLQKLQHSFSFKTIETRF